MAYNLKVQEAVHTIIDELNNLSSQGRKDVAETIHETVSRSHRTLQQSFWDALLKVQIKYADNPSDLRNEAAVAVAKAVKDVAVKNNWDIGLPYY